MLIHVIKFGIRILLLYQSEFTLRKMWYLQLIVIPTELYPK